MFNIKNISSNSKQEEKIQNYQKLVDHVNDFIYTAITVSYYCYYFIEIFSMEKLLLVKYIYLLKEKLFYHKMLEYFFKNNI